MKKRQVFLCAAALTFAIAGVLSSGCGKNENGSKVNADIVNGGFEQGVGDITGWSTTGSAFSRYGVVNSDKVNGVEVGKAGNNFFSGYDAGNPQFTGTLTSETFTLGGTGKIGFLLCV